MDREWSGDFYSINTTFDQTFSDNGHKLIADLQYNRTNNNEETTNRLVDYIEAENVSNTISGKRSTETGPSYSFDAKLDFNRDGKMDVVSGPYWYAGPEFRQRVATRLSGGERARVLLARVLAQDTPLVLADEPVAGLDPENQIATMEAFARLAS